ncbi:MAG: methyltransferase domain-containing protein [Polyangiaceae bacterium]|nr:methyltransferase domain-containing protein [Polyangiaceae bacterium]
MKLHLGCGKRFIPGYVHIDAVEYDHIDHVSGIDNLSFIPANSVDVIYNCHVLEHFKRRQVLSVLGEWRRVLKPGGILRTSVPDFAQLCKIYTATEDLNLIMGPLFGRQDYLYNIHYNVFDYKSLNDTLRQAGFENIRRYDCHETDHAHVDDYSQAYIPHMDRANGILISLNVECDKPFGAQ